MPTTPKPASPCIQQCRLSAEDICQGCYRTLNDILVWSRVDDSTKHQIIERSLARKKTANA